MRKRRSKIHYLTNNTRGLCSKQVLFAGVSRDLKRVTCLRCLRKYLEEGQTWRTCVGDRVKIRSVGKTVEYTYTAEGPDKGSWDDGSKTDFVREATLMRLK